ncbi:MAG: hypothetical protein LUP93_07660, partial [Methanomicrobiales archaeon]|nr:hypothetical protein [Methanomicrobiales archaeon]
VADPATAPAVADALIATLAPEQPVVVLAPYGEMVRVAVRAITPSRANLEAAVDAAARGYGGRASGNRHSADAVIPAGSLEGFTAALREAVAA